MQEHHAANSEQPKLLGIFRTKQLGKDHHHHHNLRSESNHHHQLQPQRKSRSPATQAHPRPRPSAPLHALHATEARRRGTRRHRHRDAGSLDGLLYLDEGAVWRLVPPHGSAGSAILRRQSEPLVKRRQVGVQRALEQGTGADEHRRVAREALLDVRLVAESLCLKKGGHHAHIHMHSLTFGVTRGLELSYCRSASKGKRTSHPIRVEHAAAETESSSAKQRPSLVSAILASKEEV